MSVTIARGPITSLYIELNSGFLKAVNRISFVHFKKRKMKEKDISQQTKIISGFDKSSSLSKMNLCYDHAELLYLNINITTLLI